jgi:Fe-S cluster assembly protein SufD
MPLDTFEIPPKDTLQRGAPIPEALRHPLLGDKQGGKISLSLGKAEVYLAPELAQKGVIFTDFRTAEREHPELLARLIGRVVSAEDGKFAALAAALAENGVLLYVPRGVRVEEPLHSILWGTGAGVAHFSRMLVSLDEGASAT